jgi:hypothetical protein
MRVVTMISPNCVKAGYNFSSRGRELSEEGAVVKECLHSKPFYLFGHIFIFSIVAYVRIGTSLGQAKSDIIL